jgi:Helix-turn-helix domain
MAEDGQRPPQTPRFDVRRLLEPFGPTMTVPQLAELLGQSAEAIRQKAQSGALPGRKLPGGRQYFFFTAEVAEILEASRVTPADADEGSAAEQERSSAT